KGRMNAHFPRNPGAADTYVYLKRGKTGAPRLIQNEDEIIDGLVKRGFVVVDITSESLESILGTLLNAKIVVSIEGSHISHYTFTSPDNSGLIVLQPPDRFIALQRAWAACLDIRYGFVVGEIASAGYYFPLADILRTVDLMLSALGK